MILEVKSRTTFICYSQSVPNIMSYGGPPSGLFGTLNVIRCGWWHVVGNCGDATMVCTIQFDWMISLVAYQLMGSYLELMNADVSIAGKRTSCMMQDFWAAVLHTASVVNDAFLAANQICRTGEGV